MNEKKPLWSRWYKKRYIFLRPTKKGSQLHHLTWNWLIMRVVQAWCLSCSLSAPVLALARSRDLTTNLEASLRQTILLAMNDTPHIRPLHLWRTNCQQVWYLHVCQLLLKLLMSHLSTTLRVNYSKSSLTYSWPFLTNFKLPNSPLPPYNHLCRRAMKDTVQVIGWRIEIILGLLHKDPMTQFSATPKPPHDIPVYWLITRDPYNGLL